MKKRIVSLALIAGILLSFGASAWAATPISYGIVGAAAAYNVKHVEETEVGTHFKIAIQAQVSASSQPPATISSSMGKIFVDKATAVKFEATTADSTTIEDLSVTTSPKKFDNTYTDTIAVTTYVTGTVKGNGTVILNMTLMNDSTATSSTGTATIEFSTTKNDDVNSDFIAGGPNESVPVTEDPNPIDATPANFDNADLWDGIDPAFDMTGTAETPDNKNAPKIITSKLEFTKAPTAKALTSGVSDDFSIQIQGDSPDVDVYVAAKDAIKLGWLSKGATTNIQLDSADIKANYIPFRVTSCTGEATTLKNKPAYVTTVTISPITAHTSTTRASRSRLRPRTTPARTANGRRRPSK